jgi:epoxide hydrolase
MSSEHDIVPFRIDVPQEDLDELADRLGRTRWPDEIPGGGGDYGVTVEWAQRLTGHWRNGYDWRAWEARLNAHPQFTTVIDGQRVHFWHVRSPEPGALPLILTHGWPGTIVEYLDVIGPLTDPRAHGLDPRLAFDVVVPSVPGWGFSGPTTEKGWNRHRVAAAWAELMGRLGYERYGAGGNDGGALISPELGRLAPDHVVGVHVTQVFSFPSGDPSEMEGLSDEDQAAVEFLGWFSQNMMGFNIVQSTQPQNLAFAVTDSPVGLLAWNGQLLHDAVSDDFLLTNVMIHWLTGTAASSMRFYWEDAHAEHPTEPTTVPLGLANFADDFTSVRAFAERDHRTIVQWNTYDTGGHYAAHQVPGLFVDDLRGFFANLTSPPS